jgi:putative hydrolase of HD superfamily
MNIIVFLVFLFSCTTSSQPLVSAAMMSSSSDASKTTTTTATATAAKGAIDFLTLARGLKTTKRTGWVRQEAGPQIESVADHSWRISLMAMVAASASASTTLDTNKCIQMALVHDLAEATVGDITPYCGVSNDEKHQLESDAMTKLCGLLPVLPGGTGTTNTNNAAAITIQALWKEYEEGVTEEAKLVKDLDKLEMILQALEYETDGKNGKSLDGFFDGTRGKWRTSIGQAWGDEIEARRRKRTHEETNNPATTTTTDEDDDDKKPAAAAASSSSPPAEKKQKLEKE